MCRLHISGDGAFEARRCANAKVHLRQKIRLLSSQSKCRLSRLAGAR